MKKSLLLLLLLLLLFAVSSSVYSDEKKVNVKQSAKGDCVANLVHVKDAVIKCGVSKKFVQRILREIERKRRADVLRSRREQRKIRSELKKLYKLVSLSHRGLVPKSSSTDAANRQRDKKLRAMQAAKNQLVRKIADLQRRMQKLQQNSQDYRNQLRKRDQVISRLRMSLAMKDSISKNRKLGTKKERRRIIASIDKGTVKPLIRVLKKKPARNRKTGISSAQRAFTLGNAYMSSLKYRRAGRMFERAAKLKPKKLAYRSSAVMAWYNASDNKRALKNALAAIRLDPKRSGLSHWMAARIYKNLGDEENEVRYLEKLDNMLTKINVRYYRDPEVTWLQRPGEFRDNKTFQQEVKRRLKTGYYSLCTTFSPGDDRTRYWNYCRNAVEEFSWNVTRGKTPSGFARGIFFTRKAMAYYYFSIVALKDNQPTKYMSSDEDQAVKIRKGEDAETYNDYFPKVSKNLYEAFKFLKPAIKRGGKDAAKAKLWLARACHHMGNAFNHVRKHRKSAHYYQLALNLYQGLGAEHSDKVALLETSLRSAKAQKVSYEDPEEGLE